MQKPSPDFGISIDQEPHWHRIERSAANISAKLGIDIFFENGYDRYNQHPREISSSWGVPTNRSIGEIAGIHGYRLSDFLTQIEGKIVLDVGGGHSYLNKDAANRYIETTIINLDWPSAFREKAFEEDTLRKTRGEVEVIASADHMPIADNSVDLIFATYSVPFHADAAEQIEGLLNEVIRVLKPGGSASISPITNINSSADKNKDFGSLRLFNMLLSLSNYEGVKLEFGVGVENGHPSEFLKITKLAHPIIEDLS